jgi:hypothetical protein
MLFAVITPLLFTLSLLAAHAILIIIVPVLRFVIRMVIFGLGDLMGPA